MEASGLTPADSALEVGPGLGSLTRHLAAVAASVTAVEKDDALYSRLVNTLTEVRLLWEPREGDRPLGGKHICWRRCCARGTRDPHTCWTPHVWELHQRLHTGGIH